MAKKKMCLTTQQSIKRKKEMLQVMFNKLRWHFNKDGQLNRSHEVGSYARPSFFAFNIFSGLALNVIIKNSHCLSRLSPNIDLLTLVQVVESWQRLDIKRVLHSNDTGNL